MVFRLVLVLFADFAITTLVIFILDDDYDTFVKRISCFTETRAYPEKS